MILIIPIINHARKVDIDNNKSMVLFANSLSEIKKRLF